MSAIEEVNSGAAGSAAMYVAIVCDPGIVRREQCSGLIMNLISKHRCVWIVDICVIKWVDKEDKSSLEMGPLEMQDGIIVAALINIFISLMIDHST